MPGINVSRLQATVSSRATAALSLATLLAICACSASPPQATEPNTPATGPDGGTAPDRRQVPGSANVDGGAPDATDDRGAPRVTDGGTGDAKGATTGTPGDAVPGVASLDGPCVSPLEKACSGHNSTNKLVCLAGKWAFNGSCDGTSRCDTRPGATQGTCQGIALECLNRHPSETVCNADKSATLTCGADLLDSSPAACRANAHCAGTGNARCECDHGDDGLGGCVALAGRYWDNGNGTVFDPTTRLTWQREVPPPFHGSVEVLKAYCATLTLTNPRGGSTWRAPSVEELRTILDTTHPAPMIDGVAFPNTADGYFYTTSLEPNGVPAMRIELSFLDGLSLFTTGNNLTHDVYVRCVQ